jgi:hypothetical protein
MGLLPKICRWLAPWCVLLAAVSGALAAEEAAWEPGETTGPIITDTAVPVPYGELSIQPYWSLGLVRGELSPSWRRVSAGGNFVTFQVPVKITYGAVRNGEVYAIVPFIQNWAGGVDGAGAAGSRSASFCGLGDINLTLKYQLLEETLMRPTVSMIFSTAFPAGHRSHLNPARLGMDALGNGSFEFTPGFNLAKWVGPVYLYANFWYSFSLRDPVPAAHAQSGLLLVPVHGRDLITCNLAAEWVWSRRWVGLLEFYSSWEVGPLFRGSREKPSALLGVLPGVECLLAEHLSCALGVAVDLAGKNSLQYCTPIFMTLIKF